MNQATTPDATTHSRPPTRPYAITIALIAINVLVFAAMVASGVSFLQPTLLDSEASIGHSGECPFVPPKRI